MKLRPDADKQLLEPSGPTFEHRKEADRMNDRSKLLATLMAVVTVTLWAASYPWSKAILAWLDPIVAAQTRYGAAAVILLALTAGGGHLLEVLRSNWKSYLVIGCIGFAVFPLLIFSALSYTSAMNASVIMALSPVMTMLGAAVFLGEALTPRTIVGLTVAVLGAVIAVVGDNPNGLAGFTIDMGEPIMFAAAACLAFYTVASRKLLKPDVPAKVNIALVLTVGAVVLLPITLVFGKAPTTAPSLDTALSLIGIVLGSTVLGYLFWMRSTQTLGVQTPNLLFNFIPVLTIIFAWLGGIAPFPEQVLGAALVIVGVSIAAWKGRRPHSEGHA
jgi:drug/metabolite transporter (DMT)-like permease